MKRIFILVAIFAITAGAMAQLKVLTNGNVGVGTNTPARKFEVKGTTRFAPSETAWKDIRIDADNQWEAPQLYNIASQLLLGTDNYPVNCVYVNWLYVKKGSSLASDEGLKENIRPLGNTLNKLLEVEGKIYNYKKETPPNGILEFEELLEKETFGFIAQELEDIFPELVDAPSTVNSYYSINYIGMIPVLVEAIKEQQIQIEQLQDTIREQAFEITFFKKQMISFQRQIDDFQKKMEELQRQIDDCCQRTPQNLSPPQNPPINENTDQINNSTTHTSVNENNISDIEKAKLFQNIPNPFSSNTEIRFEIPENSITAKLLIHDMQGAEIKSYNITAKGAGTIIVQAHELQAGMYMYTLLVNNTIIGTKKMILTK